MNYINVTISIQSTMTLAFILKKEVVIFPNSKTKPTDKFNSQVMTSTFFASLGFSSAL